MPVESVLGETMKGMIGVGANTSGAQVRYCLTDRYLAEGRVQFDTDILVGGLRFSRYFNPAARRLLFFCGVEGDFISHKSDKSEGIGAAGEFFLGCEYFFTRHFSFQTDFGSSYMYLKDKNTSETTKDVDFVVDFAVTYYWSMRN